MEKDQINEQEVMRLACEKYGVPSQAGMAIEEMSELTKELCKFLRGQADIAHIAEEIADVEITVRAVKTMMGLDTEVERWKIKKIERLSAKLKGQP